MARMWSCGFELQSTSAEFGVNSGVIVTGSPSISTSVHRAGTAALRCNPTAATSFVEHQLTSGVVMRTLHRLYLRVDTLPSTATNIYGIGQSGYFPALLRLQTDGTLVLRDGFTETTLTGTSAALTLGRWYRVELDYNDVSGTLTSGVAAFKGYLDGTLFANAMCSNTNGFSRIRMGVQLAATTDFYIDDVAVNDTSGTIQNGLPGPGSVVHLRPNAAGDANAWATAVGGTAGTANNHTRLSERPPDDATSYNQTTATGTATIDDVNIENTASAGIGSGDTITLVQVGGRVASDSSSAASIVYRIKGQAGGTVQESASVTVANANWSVHAGQSPRPYMLTAYTNPQTSTAWTAATLDTAQIGYRGDVSQSTVRRVSTLWALVEFIPATAVALPTAAESSTALPLTVRKRLTLPPATETITALGFALTKRTALPTAGETTAAQTPHTDKSLPLPTAQETSAAQTLTGHHRLTLPTAQETNAARPLTPTKTAPLPTATETTAVRALTPAKAIPLPTAAESTAARIVGTLKALLLAPATETTTASPLTPAKTLPLPTAAETNQALALTPDTPTEDEVDYEVGQPSTTWSASPPHTTWEAGQPW